MYLDNITYVCTESKPNPKPQLIMTDPYDYDSRAPWLEEDDYEGLGYLEEADYHEEHNGEEPEDY